MTERWLPVVGFEGSYEVSDHGRVRSLDRVSIFLSRHPNGSTITVRRKLKGRILKPQPLPTTGHMTIFLGNAHHRAVHVLVLTAFGGPCPPGHECCHGDDVPGNNRLENLRWGTHSENMQDAIRNGGKATGQRCSHAKLRDADIPVIRALFGQMTFVQIGHRYGVNESTIRQIRDGKAWRYV